LIGDSPEQSNYVIVGSKPMMSYVVACLTLFNEGVPGVVLRARGRNISNAVDTAEMLRRVFIRDAHIKSIKIGTDARAESEGNVSTIEIAITPR
jgi:archaea-specific DNA-binding protein